MQGHVLSIDKSCRKSWKTLTSAGTATAFSLRLRRHCKDARVGGVESVANRHWKQVFVRVEETHTAS